MVAVFLFGLMLYLMLMKVHLPIGAKFKGKVTSTFYLSLKERAVYQRVNMYSIGLVILLMSITGAISAPYEILIVLVAMGFLTIPVRVFVATEGIGINNVVFRPWSDFASFSVDTRRIVLAGKEGNPPMSLPLLAAHQKEVLPVLRRHLPEAKAGSAKSVKPREALAMSHLVKGGK